MGEFEKALDKYAKYVIQQARTNLTKGYPPYGTKNASTNLYNSLSYYVDDGTVFFEMLDYAPFVDEGVRGKNPKALSKPGAKSKDGKRKLKGSKWYGKQKAPFSPYKFGTKSGAKGGLTRGLDKWIIRKGIAPRDKEGKFMSRKTLKYLMARSIYLSGIRPTYFFSKPFERGWIKYSDEMVLGFMDDNLNIEE